MENDILMEKQQIKDMLMPLVSEIEDKNPAGIEEVALFEQKRKLPDDYKAFLQIANGGIGFIGESYVNFWKIEDLLANNKDYGVDEYVPDFLLIGTDGGGMAYGFDLREESYSIICVELVVLSYENAFHVADSFLELLRKLKNNVDLF